MPDSLGQHDAIPCTNNQYDGQHTCWHVAKCHQEAQSNRCKHAQVWKARAVIVRTHSLYSSATLSLAVGSCTWPAVCSLYAACTCRLAFSAESGMHVNMLQPDCIRPVQAEACLEQSLDCKSNTAVTNQHQALLPNAQMIVYGMHPETSKSCFSPPAAGLSCVSTTSQIAGSSKQHLEAAYTWYAHTRSGIAYTFAIACLSVPAYMSVITCASFLAYMSNIPCTSATIHTQQKQSSIPLTMLTC